MPEEYKELIDLWNHNGWYYKGYHDTDGSYFGVFMTPDFDTKDELRRLADGIVHHILDDEASGENG